MMVAPWYLYSAHRYVVFFAFLLQIHIHGVWCVEVMSPDANQHDLSLLIASGNATETQYTDICIIVCL
jgi:hypothetical protein